MKSTYLLTALAMAAGLAPTMPILPERMPMPTMMQRFSRSRAPGPRRPAGSKLWRKAQKRRLGMATIR